MIAGSDEIQVFEDQLGRHFVDAGKVDRSGLDRARRLSNGEAESLHIVLTRLGLVSEADMAQALSGLLDIPLLTRADYPDEPILGGKLSARFLQESRVIPIAETDQGLILAMADPLDDFASQAVLMVAGTTILPRVGIPADIEAAFRRLYGGGRSTMGALVEALGKPGEDATEEDIERLRDLASEAPVIKLVNHLISQAVEDRASDIHIEPFAGRLRIRYRIDGVLREEEPPPSRLHAATISRIKIMAKLNIAERRLPQDGRIRITVRGKEIDLRVSTLPTIHGESVVMRVLDRGSVTLDFPTLGFSEEQIEIYQKILHRPDGILLVTGPTGSGKTTTLYTSLMELNAPGKKILTVEDPVEYQLDGVNQIQVKPQIDLTFANILRTILRQDPDIIMVGEIRDLETAQISVQAALTGHLVLSTLHTNTAAAAATRLLEMGVEDYLLTSTVIGIIAQRLVRALCVHCREKYDTLPEMVEHLDLARYATGSVSLYRPKGCEHCNGTGYHGRTGILEIMVMTDPLRQLILKRATAGDIQQLAVQLGMVTMYEDGIRKAFRGETSLEEVLRVTRET